jgi:phosphatidylglycerophosphate synthase
MGLFVYQTLDAIDGKQARRTGSSNSLGELFDHGCDSVSMGEIKIVLFLFELLSIRESVRVCFKRLKRLWHGEHG